VTALVPILPHAQLLGISWLDPQYLLDRFGDYSLWVAAFIIFAECGLLIGFFLPGDSLLFTIGMFVSRDFVNYPLWLACLVLSVAALLGNACGYAIGYKVGPRIFHRPESKLFKQEYVTKTSEFFEKYGNRAILLARFVPIVRTFITVMAGVATMPFRRFLLYSTIGAVLWATGVTILGFYLGQIAFVRNHIEVMLVAVVLVSFVPIAVELLRARTAEKLGELHDEPS
jgi:membrane-associated protein